MSASFTPSITEDASCVFLKNDVNISLDKCSLIGENDEVYVHVIKTNFTNYVNESNGGAVLIGNCAFECHSTNFTECFSVGGGGGTIYLKNSHYLIYNITSANTWFVRCEAAFGGACCIYSRSEANEVLIEFCKFINNTIDNSRNSVENLRKDLYGGSSLFLTAKNRNVSHSSFISQKLNIGALKMYNKFDEENSSKMLDEDVSSSLNSNSLER